MGFLSKLSPSARNIYKFFIDWGFFEYPSLLKTVLDIHRGQNNTCFTTRHGNEALAYRAGDPSTPPAPIYACKPSLYSPSDLPFFRILFYQLNLWALFSWGHYGPPQPALSPPITERWVLVPSFYVAGCSLLAARALLVLTAQDVEGKRKLQKS